MRLFYLTIASLFIILVSSSCTSSKVSTDPQDQALSTESGQEAPVSPKARSFLSSFTALLDNQDRARDEALEQKKIEADELIAQSSANQTLDELLGLDPEPSAARLEELLKDLADLGEPAYKAVRARLAEDRPERQVALLLRALSAFKVKGVEQEFYQYALRAKDDKLREAALAGIRRSADRQALAAEAIQEVRGYSSGANASVATPQDRIARVSTLGAIGSQEAVEALADLLRSQEPIEVKKAAVGSLREIGGEDATAVLMDTFQRNDELRVIAAQALGSMRTDPGHEEVLLAFGEALTNAESPDALRAAAVEGLGADDGPLARRILFQLLRDTRQSRDVHQAAINVLLRGTDATGTDLAATVRLFEQTQQDYLPQMMQPLLTRGGDATVALLSERYATLSQLKKIHALRTLDRIHSDRAFEVLLENVTQERDPAVRQEILLAMRHFEGEVTSRATAAVLKQVARETPSMPEFSAALRLLGEKSPDEAAAIAMDSLYADMANRERAEACIDIIKRFGTRDQTTSLLSFKVQSGIADLEPQIDDAISSIETRERR